MSALTPIDQVIRQLCRETGEPDYKNYDTILSHVRSAFIELRLFTFPSVKTVTLKANNLGIISWPDDCVKPLLIELIRNKKSCTISVETGVYSQTDCGCSGVSDAEKDIDGVINGDKEDNNIGYDSVKVCVHDKENRISYLKLRINKGDSFSMTYNATGMSNGVTHVPIEAETAIGEWVFYKYFKRSDKGLSATSRENFKEEFIKLRKFYNDETLDDWIRAIVRK